jgi:SM-20-related protein
MNTHFEAIADGLAEHGYAVVDQFLSQPEADAIIRSEVFEKAENFRKAGIGNRSAVQVQESIRGDLIQWLDRETAPEPARVYLNRLREMTAFLNEALFLSLKDFEVHCTVYPPGSYYKRHLDQFRRDDHRRLSVICYLNPDWKEEYGGQLRMHMPQKSVDIFPIAGRLVCFRSDQIEHEVLPATRERLSITGWILDRLAELKHL